MKAHAWRACVRQKRIVGSNPTLSVLSDLPTNRLPTKPPTTETFIREKILTRRRVEGRNGASTDGEAGLVRENRLIWEPGPPLWRTFGCIQTPEPRPMLVRTSINKIAASEITDEYLPAETGQLERAVSFPQSPHGFPNMC